MTRSVVSVLPKVVRKFTNKTRRSKVPLPSLSRARRIASARKSRRSHMPFLARPRNLDRISSQLNDHFVSSKKKLKQLEGKLDD